jgi:hypothetical protein
MIPVGNWWRFTRYVIDDGWIRPAPGASLSDFDVWDSFWRRPEGHIAEPPYAQLMTLVCRLPCPGAEGWASQLEPAVEEELLSWCSEHGLLGTLLHIVRQVKWVQRYRMVDSKREGILQTFMARPDWTVVHDEFPVDAPNHPGSEVLIENFPTGEPRFEPLSTTWGRHFPDIEPKDETFDPYPSPTEEPEHFWTEYAESVSDFIRVARFFTEAVGLVREWQPREFASGLHYYMRTKWEGLGELNRMMESNSPYLIVSKDGKAEERECAPSLMGMFARMATKDILDKRYLGQCPCGKIFVSAYPDTKYCSVRHRDKYRKRAERERARRAGATAGGSRPYQRR